MLQTKSHFALFNPQFFVIMSNAILFWVMQGKHLGARAAPSKPLHAVSPKSLLRRLSPTRAFRMRAALILMCRKRGPALQVSPKCLRYGNRSLTSFAWAISWEVAEGTTLGHFVDDKVSDREHVAHAWLHDVAQFRFFGVA